MRTQRVMWAAAVLVGCGGNPEIDTEEMGGPDASAPVVPTMTATNVVPTTPPGEEPMIVDGDDDPAPPVTTMEPPPPPPPGDPCETTDCPEDQHCVGTTGTAVCTPNLCVELMCPATALCIETGTGAYCRDLTCTGDVDCEAAEFCGTDGLCTAETCTPGARRCEGNTFFECDSRGSGESFTFECGGGSTYFASTCVQGETTGCTCEDDWDCPPFTICELGICDGTGVAPTCSLPPSPFSAEDTQVEILWGGENADNDEAVGSPYPTFAQVMVTPVVANLDDDNEDGIIDEQDIPEILFLAGEAPVTGSVNTNGVIRAIHGGATVRTMDGEQVTVKERGSHYFASCNPEAGQAWYEGTEYVDGDDSCEGPMGGGPGGGDGDAVFNTSGGIAVGDLDYDGIPEIVTAGELDGTQVVVYILSNRGELLARSLPFEVMASSVKPANVGGGDTGPGGNPAPAIANVDATGNAEIVLGRVLFGVDSIDPMAMPPVDPPPAVDGGAAGPGDGGAFDPGDGPFVAPGSRIGFGAMYEGDLASGANGQGPVSCIANIVDDGTAVQEIVSGTTVYRLPTAAEGGTTLIPVWDANTTAAASLTDEEGNGFCAIADVLGADPMAPPGPDNPLDGVAEVIVQSDARLFIFEGATGTLLRDLTTVANDSFGGPPNIDDFDGDGFPEIGTAARYGYAVYDLQAPGAACPEYPEFADRTSGLRTPPDMACTTHAECGDTTQFGCNFASGRCLCLHNGWIQTTQDASSRVTGSSVFDFNGDGAAEVVYNDECHFRVYDGLSGDVLIEEWSESITRTEYPVVADVDRDGNAEIVFGSNNSDFCVQQGTPDAPTELFNNGIEVWGDQRDLWVPARGIWNQHAYHVTNITESGIIPRSEPESWKALNGRLYNTYRSNPRNYGVAPDLIVEGIQVTSPGVGCGQLGTELDIVIQIANIGDLLVGAEIMVGVYGAWDGDFVPLLDAAGNPIQIPLGSALAPRRNLLLTVPGYEPANNGEDRLPTQLRVMVDDTLLETECREDNNEAISPVMDGEDLADLTILLESVEVMCPDPSIHVIIGNQGSAAASNIQIAFYAGDPTQGGEQIHTETFAGPLEAGTTAELDVVLPIDRNATIYAVIDYTQTIPECNDGNNTASGPRVVCPNPRPIRMPAL